ncbi:hypothetical protein R8Z50_30235 [Longispora sp. K20-0274]|uniref:hypothetical protein n=1 Tax=Longispora sp. K20-0274 TaxID=3088255 RepID=UPI00399986E0
MNVNEHPWETYFRDKVRRGFAYPVGRSVIEDALRAADVQIESLSLWCPDHARWAEWSTLITATWSPRSSLRRAGSRLTVKAVPSQHRATVAEHLNGGVLRTACEWLADATGDPDSAWAGSRHQWQARLLGGAVLVDET